MTRRFVLSTVLLAGLGSAVWSQAAQQNAATGAPDPANFTGKVTDHSTSDIRMRRYSFEPGARTYWHSHADGQVVVIEKGRARVQERGGPIREFAPRQTFSAAPGVAHWHGALPGEGLTQVSLSFGTTTWMEAVTDSQYSAGRGK
jgi:quercetin dioxygenase-like cupin family protein